MIIKLQRNRKKKKEEKKLHQKNDQGLTNKRIIRAVYWMVATDNAQFAYIEIIFFYYTHNS